MTKKIFTTVFLNIFLLANFSIATPNKKFEKVPQYEPSEEDGLSELHFSVLKKANDILEFLQNLEDQGSNSKFSAVPINQEAAKKLSETLTLNELRLLERELKSFLSYLNSAQFNQNNWQRFYRQLPVKSGAFVVSGGIFLLGSIFGGIMQIIQLACGENICPDLRLPKKERH